MASDLGILNKRIISAISLITLFNLLSIQLFSQEANDSFKKYNLGSRIQFNQVHIILGFKINNNVEILTQAGYQFRYIESYERISRIRLGVLPMLASSGFMYEFGLLSTQKKNQFLLWLSV